MCADEAPSKERFDQLTAANTDLQNEVKSLKTTILDNARAREELEKDLKAKLKEAESALSKERKDAESAAEATKVLREELEGALGKAAALDKELTGNLNFPRIFVLCCNFRQASF